MPAIGPLEVGIVVTIALLIFGPKRFPELGRSFGSGVREFKDSMTGWGGGDANPRGIESGTEDDTKPPA